MSSVLDKKENNVATITITVSAEDFNKAIDVAYKKNKKKYAVNGFRRGKAPRRILENAYGESLFFEEALDEAFPAEYEKAIEEHDLKPVNMPAMTKLDKIGKEEGAVFTVEVELEPEFELGEYKGIEIYPTTYEVTEKDVEDELARVQDQNARLISVEDEPAKEGDTAVIDFEGFCDGVAFEGGKGENYPLVLGSNSFIPGFEEQLVGKKAGEEVDVNVTFPEEYHSEELAGKESLFKVKIHEVKTKELPELDDDFAADVSEFDTLDEYKESLKATIKEQRENNLKGAAINTIIEEVCNNTEIAIPQIMIDTKAEDVKAQFEQQIIQSGIDPKTYYDMMKGENGGKEEADFMSLFKEQAEHDVKQELVINKLMEVETFEITDEEKEAEIENFAKAYQQSVEQFKEVMNEDTENYIVNFIKQRKLFDFLIENAKIKEEEEPAEETTEE